jgi:hypothetical protein
MNGKERFRQLRKLLYKEIQGELSYEEKKEFLNERIEPGVLAKLQEKYLRRNRFLLGIGISYGTFLMILLLVILLGTESHVMIGLIVLAMALLPLFISLFYTRTVLGYQKLDLALRLITKFYARKHDDAL